MTLSLDDIKRIVDTADFDKFIGEIENQFFDVKGAPYLFDASKDEYRELAKDVSAFANSSGGYILIGLETEKPLVRAGDEVVNVRPLAHSSFDENRYHKILLEWLYPKPKDIEIRWVQFGEDPEEGIGVVFIPPQNERAKPFLITRSLGENNKHSAMLLGFVERRLDQTEIRRVEEIHQAIRTGFNLERELFGRIEKIELLLQKHFSSKNEAETVDDRKRLLKQRVDRILDKAKW